MVGVLEGIRVLDFGRYIAGPYCAALMAEHGRTGMTFGGRVTLVRVTAPARSEIG